MEDINHAEVLRVRASSDEICVLRKENAELREVIKFLVSEDELRDLDKNSKHWKLIDKILNK